jgi:predicted O-methyltransferase YrrM
MSIFNQLYKPFNDLLIADIGLDWNDFASDTGIYPDTAMLLVEAVKRSEVKNVLEIGSGISTLYLSAACKKYNKRFLSIEEDLFYLQKTASKFAKYGLLDTSLALDEDINYDKLIAPDLVFLDCKGETRAAFLNKLDTKNWSAVNSSIIIVDDVENPYYAYPAYEWLSKKGRFNTQIINIVGRQDRSQLINCLDPKFHSYEWVWSWRPDKKFW